jgi:hypothetical protein
MVRKERRRKLPRGSSFVGLRGTVGDVVEETEPEPEPTQGEVPEGVGPEVFRERLRQAAQQDPDDGAHIVLEEEIVFLEDIESVEAEEGSHGSRVRLRNGLIIGGLTGAAIVAALATIRYRRRRSGTSG